MGHKHSILSSPPSVTFETTFNFLTPLYEACRDVNEELVRKLLPNFSQADLNQQEHIYDGNTCLHIATANGHDSIVKLLLEKGCYRSARLNSHNQSAYEIAASNRESTRLLFVRQNEDDRSSRFYEKDASKCFDIVKQEIDSKPNLPQRKSNIDIYKIEEEIKHQIEYSPSSKCHYNQPFDHHTIIEHLHNLLKHTTTDKSNDYIKANDLINQYEKDSNSIEQLLHLYTLETEFYRTLKQDCLPLAIPLFMHLPKLKHRYFKGRVYRGMHMTYEQLLIYQIAMDTPGTLLQTRSFSSTSIDRNVAEEFVYFKTKKHEDDLCVLFIFDFPDVCDQAINLSRISADTPCLSEYENEKEVLILPWTLFKITHINKPNDENSLCTIHLINIMMSKKHVTTSLRWNFVDKDKKLIFDCKFQKYKIPTNCH